MKLYVDTGVLAAYYTPEPLSEEAEALLRAYPGPAISDLGEVELSALLARRVRRAAMSSRDAQRVRILFRTHLEAGLYTRLALRRQHYQLARDWIGRDLALAPGAALHLAAAALDERTLATADPALAEVARELGVVVVRVGEAETGAMLVHEEPSRYLAGDEPATQGLLDAAAAGAGR